MPKVSVIIPVYNAEKYLHKCVDSVLNQTLDDIEIILVDDGSTDNSPAICDDYERKYNNIKVFHKENGGVSSARNVGLDNATGEYVGFVDSDDYIAPVMYEKLFQTCKKYRCEMAICNYQITKNRKILETGTINFSANREVSCEELRRLIEVANDARFQWFNVNKLFCNDVLQKNNIRFHTELQYGEDTPFNLEAMLNSTGLVFVDEPLYFYEQTDNSAMRSKHKHNYLEKLENLYNIKIELLQKYEIQNWQDDMNEYTMIHTLPLLFGNELHYKRKFSEKVEMYRKFRNSRMIAEAMKYSNPWLIKSNLKYLAILLKYRCCVLLALITN